MASSNSAIRQNYAANSEAGVNKQINIQLYTSYVYTSMCYYFDREDVALHNIANFFKEQSEVEREQASKFMKYQNTRGGRVLLQGIQKPEKDQWGSALEAYEAALSLEKCNNQTLLELHKMAAQNNDPQMTDFIEEDFLRKQVELIEKLAKAVTNLKRVGPGLGEFMFDKENFS